MLTYESLNAAVAVFGLQSAVSVVTPLVCWSRSYRWYESLVTLIVACLSHQSRLTDYLSSNNLLNPHQSAYSKHHSTETALSYIHDHLINTIGSQKLSCLCLLDLSAPFDTIDHIILITRLSSWFGFMAPFSTGLSLTCRFGLSVLDVINASLPPIPVYVVFPKVLFLVPYFSSCIPLLSVPLSLLYH